MPANTIITTMTPVDDTIPQLSEGQVILTSPAYIVKSSTSKLKISAQVNATCDQNYSYVVHIHRGMTADAESVSQVFPPGTHHPTTTTLCYEIDSPGAGTSLTYKVIIGAQNNNHPITVNGSNGSRLFGGRYLSTLSIQEFEP